MEDSLLIAIMAGLGGMLGWGLADFFAKKSTDQIGAIPSLVWAHFFGSLYFISIAVFQHFDAHSSLVLPRTGTEWLGLAFFGFLQMLVYWLVYEAFSKGQLAILNPIFASYAGLVALSSFLFFGEQLSSHSSIALGAIFGGVILLNIDVKGLRSRRLKVLPGLKEILGAVVLATFWTVLWDRFIKGKDALTYAMIMYIFMTIASFILSRVKNTSVRFTELKAWKYLMLIGMGETVAYLAISWGYSTTKLVSVVALIAGAFSLPTVLLAKLFLNEHISKLQAFAIVILVTGLALLFV